jgi:transcriptional regulator with XRE-family HTH domain
MAEPISVGGTLYVLPDLEKARSDKQARLERQAAYLAWVLQPREERVPRTKKALAERMGVSTQTLYNYDRDPDFTAEVRRRLGAAFRVDLLPELFRSLYKTATEPENPRQVQAARTLLDWLGRAAEEGTQGALAELSDEELVKLAGRA